MSFAVTHLIGFGAGEPIAPIAIAATASSGSDSNLVTYTFSSQALGAEASERRIVVAARGGAGASRTLDTATIGGVSATIDAVAGTASHVDIFSANVPTGTTGDVVLTFSGGMLGVRITVFAITGRATAFISSDTEVGTAAAPDNVVTISSDQVAVSCVLCLSAANRTFTWTNATEADDAVWGTDSANGTSAAYVDGGTGSSTTITATASSTVTGTRMATVVYG